MPDRHSFRIVIQRIGFAGSTRYRILAYGESRHSAYGDFPTAERLLEAVRTAIPGFDEGRLALGDATEGSIMFAEDMDLDETQLRILGLN